MKQTTKLIAIVLLSGLFTACEDEPGLQTPLDEPAYDNDWFR